MMIRCSLFGSSTRFAAVVFACACLLGMAAGEDGQRPAARSLMDAAIQFHADLGGGRIGALDAEGFKSIEAIVWGGASVDSATTKTVHREWRYTMAADYGSGTLITETARVADVIGGVNQPLPTSVALAYLACGECRPGGYIPQSSRRNPHWDLEKGALEEDSQLIDPLRFINRMYGENFAEHLTEWRDTYVDLPEMEVTVDRAADGSASAVVFRDPFVGSTFRYIFEGGAGRTRLIGYERTGMAPGDPPPKCVVTITWATFTLEDGTVLEYPGEVAQFSGDTPQQTREVRRLAVTAASRGSRGREWFEEAVAARTAALTFDAVRRNLEFERAPR